jgi:hypothetical protein
MFIAHARAYFPLISIHSQKSKKFTSFISSPVLGKSNLHYPTFQDAGPSLFFHSQSEMEEIPIVISVLYSELCITELVMYCIEQKCIVVRENEASPEVRYTGERLHVLCISIILIQK